MSQNFVIEHKGTEYVITPKNRTPFLESLMDHQSVNRESDDHDHVYSALNVPHKDTPMVGLLIDSINGIPPSEFDWGNNELQIVFSLAILARVYDDTDLADSMDRSFLQMTILKPAVDSVLEKLQRGELNLEASPSTLKPIIDEALNMPDVIQQLQALGEDCPEWAKAIRIG